MNSSVLNTKKSPIPTICQGQQANPWLDRGHGYYQFLFFRANKKANVW
jgi:hypothetical protein